jgi:hypothetical protein
MLDLGGENWKSPSRSFKAIRCSRRLKIGQKCGKHRSCIEIVAVWALFVFLFGFGDFPKFLKPARSLKT